MRPTRPKWLGWIKDPQHGLSLGRLLSSGGLVFFLSTLLLAQSNIRSVSGKVVDRGGKPLAGAVVQLKNLNSLHIRSFISQKDGSYHFQRLNTQIDYELRATYRGSASRTRTLTRFDSRRDAKIDLVIEVKE